MNLFTLIFRNAFRHKLRAVLTVIGVTIALLAFCMINTMINAWYSGVNKSAKNRIITRNAVSLIFYLPISYLETVKNVPGVDLVGHGNWFGGIYKDERNRFAQFAINDGYLDVYPEFIFDKGERDAWRADRSGILIGEELANNFGLKVGQRIQIQGTIFPGMWDFTVRGIFKPRQNSTPTKQMFFHYEYLNESLKVTRIREPDHIGFFAIQLKPGADPAAVSQAIDAKFANSYAETLTETETAFQQGFVSMSETIILALRSISFVVIIIMLLVLTNTMIMAARERYREYSIIKALGFERGTLFKVLIGESLILSLIGYVILLGALYFIFGVITPKRLLGDLVTFFPIFQLQSDLLVTSFLVAVGIGVLSALPPFFQIAKLRVVDGLRRVG